MEKMIEKHSEYSNLIYANLQYNIRFRHECDDTFPYHVWSFQNGPAKQIDTIEYFHDRSKTLNICCLHEPDIDTPTPRFKENYKYDWGDTEVNILYCIHPKNADFRYSPSNLLQPTRHYFPIFWLYQTFIDMGHHKLNPFKKEYQERVSTSNATKHFVSFNAAMRPHRIAVLELLYRKNLLKNNYYSLISKPVEEAVYKRWWGKTNWNSLFELEDIEVPICDPYNFTADRNYYRYGLNYTDSAFQAVSETTTNTILWSEKTFSPILNSKPFLLYGARNINETLTEYGFKLYDNIFDYSFDDEEDDIKRAIMYVEEIERVTNKYSPQDIYNGCKNIASYNLENAFNIIKNKLYFSELFQEWEDLWRGEHHWDSHVAHWYTHYERFKQGL